MNFGHVLTAMVTPFDENGAIDFDKTSNLIEHLINHGTDGLIVSGTTGESPTLTYEEKIALFKHVVKVVDKRIPVIAGTGSNCTDDSITLTKEAEACGVDGIMLVVPYYNKPSQTGLYKHFTTIAKETTLPIMLYNIPGRSGINMTAETVIELSKVEQIVSVKEASGNLDQATKIIAETDESFTVYSGDDGLTLPMMSIGGNGIVSVASHVIGLEMQEMIQAFLQGDHRKAATLHQELLPIMNGLFQAPSPAPVKAALKIKGVDCGGVRLPLVELNQEEYQTLEHLMTK
ncbi:4-hydroxy-tetrahydrodipicolinate synthase [Cerasibacillus quisquiliarum]|uniref:4-hydroxy-tetrahydrodipicolinate synthase n=1 Tax=Cerasibacillus quisquiliarum TaxID=227865 RepID=A0A511UZE2_9BACI|nr:4-hydroxy-tetrahydrodipicolinate synthase [Cerasibacillus quisquiliarum]MBB5145911.1 4-hydroxy-tetrahydrodipicolinate synthase [Cerasibacillus quisquiliarum]GEN30482.1 4-hydroxy-tetrahydrodipicolinate synthase [Cerasibacillus quisquiliarum]